jgi:hypothetical protein
LQVIVTLSSAVHFSILVFRFTNIGHMGSRGTKLSTSVALQHQSSPLDTILSHFGSVYTLTTYPLASSLVLTSHPFLVLPGSPFTRDFRTIIR